MYCSQSAVQGQSEMSSPEIKNRNIFPTDRALVLNLMLLGCQEYILCPLYLFIDCLYS